MGHWEGVSEFVAVAETQSFTAAAAKLQTSVAQVSRKIAALEERLAVKLFHRTTRKVSVTEAGRIYFQHCKPLVEGLELAELSVTEMQSQPKGLLRVTAPVTYGEMNLAPLLHQFLERYPLVDLELLLTNQKLNLIEQGLDIAIRLGRLQDCSLIAKRLASRQLYVCASTSYLEQFGEPHTLSELTHHQCLIGSSDTWHFREQGRDKSLRISGRIKCNSGFALVDAAKRGLGLVQLPDYYVQDALLCGDLMEVLSHYRAEQEGIWALYPQNRNLSPKVRALIDFLTEHLAAS
ncbi:LysR family transcriptional regulator [Vibrio sp. SM6]|uniref:LysR family transcriptional regulator n=1 Tax=Vibrio agarilyticus TaxID=2726741 RepID=A0A7X8YI95_9VIBR|nr:LysR family transcriptional regulator [Vibrio agarilyticus]NLS14167.1 LysR family transcriptional regulator [Vibrio agarilyticus]